MGKVVSFSGVEHTSTGQERGAYTLCSRLNRRGGFASKRVDLQGQPVIPGLVDYVFDTSRSTRILLLWARMVRIYL